ncbi:DUF3013 family protein [Streptococcus mutans]|uniref:DUF3013 domain-containing protein n=3 Tax=Streptococcus mutans TaxID=1309 RepID=A0A829BLC9_STRMG|nr:DUF3013 family protein [Streptococcus mutans]EMB97757.1 hypothetical protein SMU62_02039 [Streptococcus mutans M21]EMC04412.1 hypothetical protein SMU69_07825 [Streptococcus mutans NLML4]EMC18151.1 hypothetical protein SMU78_03554 [Streptococcus mutans W6]EMC24298.1 hypothetical protein SMU82_04428 [Streptococcus mutans SM6]EMC26286.1 hypothetical protein SMU83_06759 [Streptococcus mutans ST1]
MAKYGFLSVLEEEMDKHFHYDYALDWNKKNHAVELSFVLEVQNADSVETIDDKGEVSNEDIIFEDYVLFYNPAKSKFDADDYLVTVPYDPKKGLSREYLAYFAQTLNDVAIQGLDDLMDFLTDETVTDFSLEWDTETFDNGRAELEETEYYGYPRY